MMILLCIYYVIACALTTAIASALHGGDYFGKWYIKAVHCLLFPLSAPFFWGLFRNGKQADSELDLLGKDPYNYGAVEKAYYLKPLGKLMVRVMKYCMENPWSEFGVVTSRRQQEICGGFVLGIVCAVLGLFVLVPLWSFQ